MADDLKNNTKEEEKKVDFFSLSLKARTVFNPNTPISEKDLFSGRKDQLRRIIDVIFQKGQHAIIFGERGVGKTSMANVLQDFFPSKNIIVARINGDSSDTFYSVWKKVLDKMKLTSLENTIGFNSSPQLSMFTSENFLRDDGNVPDQVYKALERISHSIYFPIIIIDEFDRICEEVRKLFADFIKGLSDYAASATIILIGVGESINELINEHESVSRALAEIQMTRMTPQEIEDILKNGVNKLGMTINNNVLDSIKTLVKGLPHYAHLIGLHAVRNALDQESLNVTSRNLDKAIECAIEDSNHSIKTAYYEATRSTKKDTLFADVLLACAMAEVNELGEFAAQDLRQPMKKITGKNYDIPAYAKHLNEFSEEKRGNILIKTGDRRKFRYKFKDPLMQPFVMMKWMQKKGPEDSRL